MNNVAIRRDDVLIFLFKNHFTSATCFEHIGSTEKGKRLLNYLGLKYDYEAYTRYAQVYQAIPKEHKDAVKLVTDKDKIGRKDMHFQWIYSIIVPKYFNDGSPIPPTILKELKEEFISHFGGATCFNAKGYYQSPYGIQEDKCEILEGFGTNDSQKANQAFIDTFAVKVGSSKYCKQDAITISEKSATNKIIDTLDMKDEIAVLSTNRLFSMRSMVLLAGVAATDFSEQNLISVIGLANALGFVEY